MLTYTQAPGFISGSWMLASEQVQLAEAFNSRLRGGVADPTRRIHFYVLNNYRKVRIDGFSETPLSQLTGIGEWSMYYSHIDYDVASSKWPRAEANDYYGANGACPSMQFIFGASSGDATMAGEGNTLSAMGLMFSPGSDYQNWQNAKQQRGAYDPTSGSAHVPMFQLAQSHSMITTYGWSNHGKSYGGFLPMPRILYYCQGEQLNVPSFEYKFTRIDTGLTEYTGTGTCGLAFGGAMTDVYARWEGPYAWYIFQWDGQFFRFDKKEYIEGPYDGGGYLQRPYGDQIERLMISPYLAEFRGDVAQRNPRTIGPSQSRYDVMEHAFDYDSFLKGQYQLAPAYATTVDGALEPVYPVYSFVPGGTFMASGSVTGLIVIPSGFTLGGRLIYQNKLSQPVSIGQFENGVLAETITLNPNTSSICITFESKSCVTVQFKLLSDAIFTAAGGYIRLETSDLMIYKPEIWDAYAFVRMSSADTVGEDDMDVAGTRCVYSKELWDNYRHYGAVMNIHNNAAVTQQLTTANTNPVYDASRRFCQSFTRVVHGVDIGMPSRKLVKGYEVSQSIDGVSGSYYTGSHSILYLSRYLATDDGWVDMFPGIVDIGTPTKNGIKTNAPTGSYSNEWLMFMCTKPYKSITGGLDERDYIWKPELYGNNYPYINRCHFFSPEREIGRKANEQLFHFFQEIPDNMSANEEYRTRLIMPESLPGYNYASCDKIPDSTMYKPVNVPQYDPLDPVQVEDAKNFYRSCQVYPPDYDIQSTTVENWGGEEVVKIVFKTRFQHTSVAPDIIPLNPGLWNSDNLQAEPYRTDENAIRAFIIQLDGFYNDFQKTGDQAANSTIREDSAHPFGSIWPTFFFTKLIPKPYISVTPLQTTCSACIDSTRCYPTANDIMVMDVYLRAMCEGYVDEVTSMANACNDGFDLAYDYTYENLIYDATVGFIGGRRKWVSSFNYDDRTDKPIGYGTLPTVRVNATTLNTIAKAVNLLTRARLILPWELEVNITNYANEGEFSLTDYGEPYNCCAEEAVLKGLHLAPMTGVPAVSAYYNSGWHSSTAAEGRTYLKWDGQRCGTADDCKYRIQTFRQRTDYRFKLVDDLSLYAVPSNIQGLLSTAGNAGFYGTVDFYETSYTYKTVPTFAEGYQIAGVAIYQVDGGYLAFENTRPEPTRVCGFFYDGYVDAGSTPPSSTVSCATMTDDTEYKGDLIAGEGYYLLAVKNTRDMIIKIPTI